MNGTGAETGTVAARARLLSEAGRDDEALRLLGPHLAANPGDLSAWERYGWSALAVGDLPAAGTAVTRLATAAPDEVDTHLLAAYVLGRQGRAAEADHAIERAIELAPTSDRPFYTGAHVHYVTDRVGYQSRRWARRAVELNPTDDENQRLMGLVLAEGDWSVQERREAEPFLRTALRLNPASLGTAQAWAYFRGRTDRPAAGLVEWERTARSSGGRPNAVRQLHSATVGWLTREGTLSSWAGGLAMATALPLGPIAGRLVVLAVVILLYRGVPTPTFARAAATVGRQARHQFWIAGLAVAPAAVFVAAISFVVTPTATAILVSAGFLLVGRWSRRRVVKGLEQRTTTSPEPDETTELVGIYSVPAVPEPTDEVAELMDAGRYAEADDMLTARLAADPGDASDQAGPDRLAAWEQQILARLGRHRPDLAWVSLGHLQAIAGGDPLTLRCEARVLTASGRFAEAAAAIDDAIAADSADLKTYVVGIRLQLAAEQVTARTVALAERAVALDPDDPALRELLTKAAKAARSEAPGNPSAPAPTTAPIPVSAPYPARSTPPAPRAPGIPSLDTADPVLAARHAELSGAGHAITTGWAINIVGVPAVIWPVFFHSAVLQRTGPAVVLVLGIIFWIASLTDGVNGRSLIQACRVHRQVLMTAIYDIVGIGVLVADVVVPLSQLIVPMLLAAVVGGYHCLKVPQSLSKESLTRKIIG